MKTSKLFVACEGLSIFLLLPAVMYFHATRLNVHVALWLVAIYVLVAVKRTRPTSWRELWKGRGWTRDQKRCAFLRFCVATPLIILVTFYLAPARLFSFPIQRPGFWVLVMVLYPVLSVLPQEFVFRSFFFGRYKLFFKDERTLMALSTLSFAFMHIVFHNFVSPVLCLIAGALFAHSYSQHRSLKWVVIEHAAYGCMVFTVGIGFYFLVGGGLR